MSLITTILNGNKAAVSGTLKAGKSVLGTVARPFKGPAKGGLIGAGIVAATFGIGALVDNLRDRHRVRAGQLREEDLDNLELPPVQTYMPQSAAPTLMGMPPVAGQHAQRVMAGRGMAVPQQEALNPAMNVAENVPDLGSVPVRQ